LGDGRDGRSLVSSAQAPQKSTLREGQAFCDVIGRPGYPGQLKVGRIVAHNGSDIRTSNIDAFISGYSRFLACRKSVGRAVITMPRDRD
jgi:hypothetical protein